MYGVKRHRLAWFSYNSCCRFRRYRLSHEPNGGSEAYEIDLSIPVAQEETIVKQVEFPKPLAVEDVSQRVAAVSQTTNPAAGGYGGGTPSETPQAVAPASIVAPGSGTLDIPGAHEGTATSFDGIGQGANEAGGPVGEGLVMVKVPVSGTAQKKA